MLEKYTQTPKEILELMNGKSSETDEMVNSLMNNICNLPNNYRGDVKSSILNMIEKYFSISYPDKKIFTKDRDAYPLKLNATDEEDSTVEQKSALENPLQSKGIFFDNKKSWTTAYLMKGEKVTITGDALYPALLQVKGGRVNDQLNSFRKSVTPLLKEQADLIKILTSKSSQTNTTEDTAAALPRSIFFFP